MANNFQELELYKKTNWYNYNPPSIDQVHLLNIEDNIELNRNTINEIIKRLGVPPSGGASSDNQGIYNTSIYDTLIDFKNHLKQLDDSKLNRSDYLKNLGDMSSLKGGTTLVAAINNRLRKDQDDSSIYSYSFKKLTLTDSLSVATTSVLTGNVTMGGAASVAKNLTVNGATTLVALKATGATTLTNTLSVTGKTTLNGGLDVKGGGTVVGTLTVDKLVVTGDITCSGNINTSNSITAASNISAEGSITANGELRTRKNYINMAYDQSIKHTLWVQGAVPTLGGGDAVIVTVQ